MLLCKVLANVIKPNEFDEYKKEIDELFIKDENQEDDIQEITINEEEKLTINPTVSDIIIPDNINKKD